MFMYVCPDCIGKYNWYWQEAFLRIKSASPDENTCCVLAALQVAGYEVKTVQYQFHKFICSIIKDGIEHIPETADIGFDNPQDYLPEQVSAFLDKAFLTEWPYRVRRP